MAAVCCSFALRGIEHLLDHASVASLVNLAFPPACTNVLLRKDLQLGLIAGKELGVPMPLAAAADMLIAQAIGAGYTGEDFATLVLEQARRSGYAIESEDTPVDDGLAPEEA